MSVWQTDWLIGRYFVSILVTASMMRDHFSLLVMKQSIVFWLEQWLSFLYYSFFCSTFLSRLTSMRHWRKLQDTPPRRWAVWLDKSTRLPVIYFSSLNSRKPTWPRWRDMFTKSDKYVKSGCTVRSIVWLIDWLIDWLDTVTCESVHFLILADKCRWMFFRSSDCDGAQRENCKKGNWRTGYEQ